MEENSKVTLETLDENMEYLKKSKKLVNNMKDLLEILNEEVNVEREGN